MIRLHDLNAYLDYQIMCNCDFEGEEGCVVFARLWNDYAKQKDDYLHVYIGYEDLLRESGLSRSEIENKLMGNNNFYFDYFVVEKSGLIYGFDWLSDSKSPFNCSELSVWLIESGEIDKTRFYAWLDEAASEKLSYKYW